MTTETVPADNPILHIEEFGRFPLSHRRSILPSTSIVYRSRSGRLSSPPGGYTHGELFWRRPREAYHVNMAKRFGSLDCVLAYGSTPQAAMARLGVCWQVSDPMQVVRTRMTEPRSVALFIAWAWCVEATDLRLIHTTEQLFAALAQQMPVNLQSKFGIEVDLLTIKAISRSDLDGSSDLGRLEDLLGGDAATSWQNDFNLAQAALLAIPSDGRQPEDPVVAQELAILNNRVIQRFAEMVERLGNLMPYEGDPEP